MSDYLGRVLISDWRTDTEQWTSVRVNIWVTGYCGPRLETGSQNVRL
jgi:hypothetical protein